VKGINGGYCGGRVGFGKIGTEKIARFIRASNVITFTRVL